MSEVNKNTAFYISNVIADLTKERIMILRDEVANLIEAQNHGLIDDASDHARNAVTELYIITSNYVALTALSAVEDGSWPKDAEIDE